MSNANLPTPSYTRNDQLLIQAMDDLQMDPTEFGAILYEACARWHPLDTEEMRQQQRWSKTRILSLPYGFELIHLEQKTLAGWPK